MFRPVDDSDSDELARIYNHYIATSTISFEEQEVSADEMSERISDAAQSDLPWLVYEAEGRVGGFARTNIWKQRSAYRFTVEVSIYLDPDVGGHGIGTRLYEALFKELRARPYHAAIGVISLPNPTSVALHEKLGMHKAAHFKEVGYKFGRWIDVGYWQIVFDD